MAEYDLTTLLSFRRPVIDAANWGEHLNFTIDRLDELLGGVTDDVADVIADLITHAAAVDPHTGHLKESDANAKGDLFVASANDAVARQAVGANSQLFVADSAQTNGVKWATLTIPVTHSWAISGEIKVPSGDTDFINPFFVMVPSGWTAELARCRYVINSGTSATAKLQKNGSDITGFTGLSVTPTAGTTDPANVSLADIDKLALVVTAVAGTPKNLAFSLDIRLTFAG